MNASSPLRILLVGDDPSLLRQLEQLLGSEGAATLVFADTANAIGRAFHEHGVDLVLAYADSAIPELSEALHREVRESEHAISVIAVVEPEDHTAMATVARFGVEGLVSPDKERRLK